MSFRKMLLLLGALAVIKTLPAQTCGVKAVRNLMLPTRDGVKLGTNAFLPEEGAAAGQRFPAIVERTPYNKNSVAVSLS